MSGGCDRLASERPRHITLHDRSPDVVGRRLPDYRSPCVMVSDVFEPFAFEPIPVGCSGHFKQLIREFLPIAAREKK